ncbi:MAG: hypothetical protein HC794_08865 [Nitrospiraceae bacterium]|nr:hypothetical protein [Nitrospiraceae bacterium]
MTGGGHGAKRYQRAFPELGSRSPEVHHVASRDHVPAAARRLDRRDIRPVVAEGRFRHRLDRAPGFEQGGAGPYASRAVPQLLMLRKKSRAST